jgi:hypothetical protein
MLISNSVFTSTDKQDESNEEHDVVFDGNEWKNANAM